VGIVKLQVGSSVSQIHPQIVRVNRSLYRTAQTFLYTLNTFIVFDFTIHLIDKLPAWRAIRFVAGRHLEEFQHHTVYVNWS